MFKITFFHLIIGAECNFTVTIDYCITVLNLRLYNKLLRQSLM